MLEFNALNHIQHFWKHWSEVSIARWRLMKSTELWTLHKCTNCTSWLWKRLKMCMQLKSLSTCKTWQIKQSNYFPTLHPIYTQGWIKSWVCDNDFTLDAFCRVWDVRSQEEVKKIELDSTSISMDLSQDGSVLVVTHQKATSFYDTSR